MPSDVVTEEVAAAVEVDTPIVEEEVEAPIVEDETPTLPSDEEVFEIPEKFKGKSAEEIAKAYVELERMKAEKAKEDSPPEAKEEHTKEEVSKYQDYVKYYEQNGAFTDEHYAEMEKLGYSKEVVDREIDFYNYRKEKTLNSVLEPLGGGTEKFKEVAVWANENKTPEDIAEFNKALAASSKVAQQAMLRGLYAEYDAVNKSSGVETTIHSNTAPVSNTKGYSNESEFFKDIDNPAYKTDKNYAKQVEAKLARSNTDDWSF